VLFDEDSSRRREAAENLFRRANDPLERAEAIAELVRLQRERAGIDEATSRCRSRKRLREEAAGMCETMSHVYGWADEIGAEIGFSKRTIQRDLFLYRGLQPSVIELLREKRHPVLKNAAQLRVLAKLEPSEQAFAARQLANGLAKTVNEAIRRSRGSNSVARSAEDKRLATFIDTFGRMSLTEKRGALAQLAGMLPAPFKLVEERFRRSRTTGITTRARSSACRAASRDARRRRAARSCRVGRGQG
jgi:hypothetical protein